MNHRYEDDNYSRRERDENRDRDRDRDREREGREGQSFYPGGYGFEEQSSPYGQREPYSTSGSGGGTYGASGYGQYRGEGQGGSHRGRDENRSPSPQDYSREWRSEGRGDYRGGSRYSESQYGQGRSEYDPRRNWGGRSTEYRGSQGWDDSDRGSPYGDRSGGREGQYGNRGSQSYGGSQGSGGRSDYGRGDYYSGSRSGGSRFGSDRSGDDDYGRTRRYGVGYSGSTGFDRDSDFRDDRFSRGDEPRYYGTGYYAEGTSAFGGGFGEERWRSQPSSTGWLRESERGRFFGGGHDDERRERPGFFRRLFGKGPKGYQRSDERLREDISERLMESNEIDSSEVTVMVASGKVTLEGTVPDRNMKHSIEDLVDACPGVQDIDNRIRVDRNMGSSGSSGYTGVSSASSTTPGSTGSTGTSYGSTGTSGMSSGSSLGAGSSTGTTTGSSTPGVSGTNRSTRKDS